MRKPELKFNIQDENPRGHAWGVTDSQGYCMECVVCGAYVNLEPGPNTPEVRAIMEEMESMVDEDCPCHNTNLAEFAKGKAGIYSEVMEAKDYYKYRQFIEEGKYDEAEEFRMQYFKELLGTKHETDGVRKGWKD